MAIFLIFHSASCNSVARVTQAQYLLEQLTQLNPSHFYATKSNSCYMLERTHILKCPCPKGSIVLSLLLACKSYVLKECHLKAAKQYNDDVTTASSKRSKFLLKVQLGGESSCICLICSAGCYSVLQEESAQVRDAPQSQIVCFLTLFKWPLTPPHFENLCCGLYCGY